METKKIGNVATIDTEQIQNDLKVIQDVATELAHKHGRPPTSDEIREGFAAALKLSAEQVIERIAALEAFGKTAPEEPKFATLPLPKNMKEEPPWWPNFRIGERLPWKGVEFSIREVNKEGILIVPVKFNMRKAKRKAEKRPGLRASFAKKMRRRRR